MKTIHRLSIGGAAACALALFATPMLAQKDSAVSLGRLSTGAIMRFVKDASDQWGIEMAGGDAPHLTQAQPARFEIYTGAIPGPVSDAGIKTLAGSYKTVAKSADGVIASGFHA